MWAFPLPERPAISKQEASDLFAAAASAPTPAAAATGTTTTATTTATTTTTSTTTTTTPPATDSGALLRLTDVRFDRHCGQLRFAVEGGTEEAKLLETAAWQCSDVLVVVRGLKREHQAEGIQYGSMFKCVFVVVVAAAGVVVEVDTRVPNTHA